MAKFTLTTPVRIGDLISGVTIGELTLVGFSINSQAGSPTFSILLQDLVSGWMHSVMVTGAEGTAALAALRTAFPTLETAVLTYLVNEGKLPPGTVG